MRRLGQRVYSWGWKAILLSACLLLITPALAQSNSSQTEQIAETPLEQLGNVRVYSASKHLQTITEAPSVVTVITGDQIRKFGYRTLSEVLQSVAGFYIDYDRNYTYVGVRGFARTGDYNSRILLLLDGHRMNDLDPLHQRQVQRELRAHVSAVGEVLHNCTCDPGRPYHAGEAHVSVLVTALCTTATSNPHGGYGASASPSPRFGLSLRRLTGQLHKPASAR